MLILTVIMTALLGYQVTMPQVDNAKYSVTIYEGQIIRMNTQNGSFEICDKEFRCQPVDTKR